MFADDLIIVSKTSWSSAKNYRLCLNIYSDLTGQ